MSRGGVAPPSWEGWGDVLQEDPAAAPGSGPPLALWVPGLLVALLRRQGVVAHLLDFAEAKQQVLCCFTDLIWAV